MFKRTGMIFSELATRSHVCLVQSNGSGTVHLVYPTNSRDAPTKHYYSKTENHDYVCMRGRISDSSQLTYVNLNIRFLMSLG